MSDTGNMLKEVDLQIVYRRLEARKKNITGDGRKMTKAHLATAYRGYHGLESQYYALQHMSKETMIHTKLKNDQVKLKHVEDMKYLIENETMAKGNAERDIKNMREDFTTQLAYQYVYKNYSFKKYDQTREKKKPRPLTDKPEMYDKERRSASQNRNTRPLGSLRQIENYKGELKLPAIKNQETTSQAKTQVNMLGDKTYVDLKQDAVKQDNKASFPNIEGAMGVEIKYKYNSKEDDKASLYSAPAGVMDTYTDNKSLDNRANVQEFDMGQNLMLMRKLAKERYEKQRELPAPPPSRNQSHRESMRRILPTPPTRAASLLPGNTKNDVQMKKMLKRQVSDVMDTWSTLSSRMEQNEKLKEIDKAKQSETPIPAIDFSRSTSEIFREYRMYREQRKILTEQQDNEQPIVIRQLSPQPRIESPVAQRRSEYSTRISSPSPKRESSPHVVRVGGKLRRTDSEKFPSVSRTSSYRNLPDGPIEIHEHALLTAAERIEIEKEKLKRANDDATTELKLIDVKSNAHGDTDKNTNLKPRRKLPQTPVSVQRHERSKKVKDRNVKQKEQMFDTSVLKLNTDTDIINKMQIANKGVIETILVDKPPINKNSERNPYKPIAKQGLRQQGEHDNERQRYVNNVSGQMLPPKLAKRMQYDYEHFSRTTPEMKKQLELKAKAKRKIQLKNAKLAEERLKKKGSHSVVDGERPPTRVSFNENVMVFQTI